MTKEELEKEAEEYVSKYEGWGWIPHKGSAVYQAMLNSYLAGAEPREKRIAELEDKLMDKVCLESLDIVSAKINGLEKENAELKESGSVICDRLSERIDETVELKNENIGLKNQLTNAKEIIREFVEWANWQGNSKCPSFKSIQDKAEQFLNSEMEK